MDVETHAHSLYFSRARVRLFWVITLSDQLSIRCGCSDYNLFSETSFSLYLGPNSAYVHLGVHPENDTLLHYVPLKLQSSLEKSLEKEEITIIKLDVNKFRELQEAALRGEFPDILPQMKSGVSSGVEHVNF